MHFSTKAQLPVSINYHVKDGLPGGEIYDIIQDEKGYLWFATEYGPCRYDGYEFRTFTILDGLPENSTIRIFQDHKGRIWFSSFTGKISYYENGKIYSHKLNEEISRISNKYYIDNIYVTDNDEIWLAPKKGGFFKIISGNKIETIKDSINNYLDYFVLFERLKYGHFVGWINNRSDTLAHLPSKLVFSENAYYLRLHGDSKIPLISYYDLNSDSILFGFGKKVFLINDLSFKKVLEFQNRVTCIYSDENKNTWIGVENEGVYLFTNLNFDAVPKIYLKNITVSKILLDNEGIYWFATIENGLYKYPGIQFKIYDILPGANRIKAMDLFDSILYLSTDQKKIYKCFILPNEEVVIQEFKFEGKNPRIIADVLCHTDGSIWLLNSDFLCYDKNGRKIPIMSKGGYDIVETENGEVLIASSVYFCKFQGSKQIFNSAKIVQNESEKSSYFRDNFRAIYEDSEGVIWLGTLRGLYSYDGEKYKFYGDENPILKNRITDINGYKDILFVGTRENGLVVKISENYYHLNKSRGLNSNTISVISIDNDSTVWIGTNNGLNKILITNAVPFEYNITSFTTNSGLPSGEITDIIRYNENIWIGTSKGLVSVNTSELNKSTYPPGLYLDSIKINDSITWLSSPSHDLAYYENDITFYFKGISFLNPGNLTYYYKLVGIDKSWKTTKNVSVKYASLPPGNHTFIVKVLNDNGIWGLNPVKVKFKINKHFTQTAWFIIVVALTGTIILFIVFLIILRNNKRKDEFQRKLILSQLTALRAQMNPHFIFNSLNSIQNFILDHDSENADFYLANFSSLMRKILENSKHNLILLSEVIETIKLYLGLEELRFEGKFKYQINIDESIDTTIIHIPPMLIQPFLENAIWHGLMPKGDKGLLKFSLIKIKDGLLLCRIEDNGIGREKAEMIKTNRKKHKSTGMKNIEERIDLLNKMNKTNLKMQIIDLHDPNGHASGTRIEINIPYDKEF